MQPLRTPKPPLYLQLHNNISHLIYVQARNTDRLDGKVVLTGWECPCFQRYHTLGRHRYWVFAHPATSQSLCGQKFRTLDSENHSWITVVLFLWLQKTLVLLLCLAVSVLSPQIFTLPCMSWPSQNWQPLWFPTVPGRKVVEDIPTNHSPGGSVSKTKSPSNCLSWKGYTPDPGVCTKLQVWSINLGDLQTLHYWFMMIDDLLNAPVDSGSKPNMAQQMPLMTCPLLARNASATIMLQITWVRKESHHSFDMILKSLYGCTNWQSWCLTWGV